MSMTVTALHALRIALLTSCIFTLLISGTAMAQGRSTPDAPPTPLAEAQAALERRDWAAAEFLLGPLTQTEPKNPFAYFELAQLYENTNRVEAARNIYQAIAAIPEAEKANYVVIAIRDDKKYMVLLPNLAQEKLALLGRANASAAPSSASSPIPSSVPAAAVTARSAAPAMSPPGATATPVPSSSAIENTPQVMAMRQWLAAWQSKQLDNYFASYVPGYKGDMSSSSAWQKTRSERINTKTKININAYDVSVTPLDAQQAQVNFTQAYVSPSLVSLATKTLVMVNSNGRWLISKETAK